MIYHDIRKGVFLRRPNRFIAHVEIGGREETVHVKNTGRCRELLVPGSTVYVQHHSNPCRKTRYSLIAVEKGAILVNIDSQAPNKAAREWLLSQEPFGKTKILKPESMYGRSRFDFYLETEKEKWFVEIKGVTLEKNGVVLFPDAPTERGVKHLEELCSVVEEGYRAAIVFIAQLAGAKYFTPNRDTHPEFAEALKKACRKGVKILVHECLVTPESMVVTGEIPLRL